MKKKNDKADQFANWLSDKQGDVLKKWEKKMRETEQKPSQLTAMSRKEFRDDIPDFLKRLINSLKGEDKSSLEKIAKKHGTNRWDHGFDLAMTIEEWEILQKVIQDEITSFLKKSDIDSHSLNGIHQILTSHIQKGIKFSIKKFDQLEQEKSEAQRKDLEQALEKPENISRKHDLRSASHDLKGIMYSIQFGFKLLQDEDLSPKVSELIDQMTKGANSLEQLLNDLLDLFRLETKREKINISEFDAAKTLAQLCESMQPMAKTEKLELKCDGTGSLPVKGDKKKVERIARNLLLNALKYTKEGYVKVKCEKLTDEHWLLEISDTGPGLDATHAQSLTSNTVSKSQQAEVANSNENKHRGKKHGEGIGLLIVRHLCRLLDAAINIETQSGEGTTFKIVFPLELSEE